MTSGAFLVSYRVFEFVGIPQLQFPFHWKRKIWEFVRYNFCVRPGRKLFKGLRRKYVTRYFSHFGTKTVQVSY